MSSAAGEHVTGMSVQDVVAGFLSAYGLPGWPVRFGDGTGQPVNRGADDIVELGYAAARADLGWQPVWDLSRALRACAAWYQAAQARPDSLAAVMDEQIAAYTADASRVWAADPAATAATAATPPPPPRCGRGRPDRQRQPHYLD